MVTVKYLYNDVGFFMNKMMSEISVLFFIRMDSTQKLRITPKFVENLANYARNNSFKTVKFIISIESKSLLTLACQIICYAARVPGFHGVGTDIFKGIRGQQGA